MLKETVFANGRPVGVLLVDTFNRQISFHPTESPSLLPDRSWNSLDEMRQAIVEAYSRKEGSDNNESPH